MAYCKNCGEQISSEAYICPKCGVRQVHADEGSFWGGFFLTAFLPVIGLIVALVMDKPETRRGAIRCVVTELMIVPILGLMVVCVAGTY